MVRRMVYACFALATAAVAGSAAAWSQGAEFGVRAHGHSFHKAKIESSDCNLRYRLYFNAPTDAYGSASKAHFQFRARIRFASGSSVISPVFGNRGAGERVYERDYDTSSEGCWAKQEQKLLGVDVEACRGRGCTPAPFQ
ncbi:MAG: hypothetical protein ACOY0T_16325 [Myxococcota bacterium]